MPFSFTQKFTILQMETNVRNFLVKIAKVEQTFTPNAFVEEVIADMKAKIGNDKVVLGLSGGVDSTVAAVILNKAIGDNFILYFRK